MRIALKTVFSDVEQIFVAPTLGKKGGLLLLSFLGRYYFESIIKNSFNDLAEITLYFFNIL